MIIRPAPCGIAVDVGVGEDIVDVLGTERSRTELRSVLDSQGDNVMVKDFTSDCDHSFVVELDVEFYSRRVRSPKKTRNFRFYSAPRYRP